MKLLFYNLKNRAITLWWALTKKHFIILHYKVKDDKRAVYMEILQRTGYDNNSDSQILQTASQLVKNKHKGQTK